MSNVLNESVVVTDAFGQIVFWNSMAESMYGWPAAEVTGKNILDVVTLGDPNVDAQTVVDTLEASEAWAGPIQVRRHDGSTIHTIVTNHPVLDDDGSLVAVVGVGLDATRLHAATESRDALSRRFQVLIESSGDLFAITDTAAVVQSLDGPVEALFGVGPEAFLGRSLFEMVRPDDLARAHDNWDKQLATPTSIPSEDYWTQRPDGAWLCLNLQTTHLDQELGVPVVAVVARDVTARKNLERSRVATAATNSALVHATDEGDLLDEICRVVIDQTSYHLAWIGLTNSSRSLGVRMVAHAGHSAAYVEALGLLAGDQGYSGPLTQALKSHELVVVHDVDRMPGEPSWRDLALQFGFRSLIALPLTFSDRIRRPCELLHEAQRLHRRRHRRTRRTRGRPGVRGRGATNSGRSRRVPPSFRGESRGGGAGHRHRGESVIPTPPVTSTASPNSLPRSNRARHRQRCRRRHQDRRLDPRHRQTPGTCRDPQQARSPLGRRVRDHQAARPGRPRHRRRDRLPWPVAEMILQHHERLDGSGYPNNLSGPDIIIGARIIAVADTVEAMQAYRPYRPGLGIDAALRQIEHDRSTLFDAEVVDACLHLFRDGGFGFGV